MRSIGKILPSVLINSILLTFFSTSVTYQIHSMTVNAITKLFVCRDLVKINLQPSVAPSFICIEVRSQCCL
ncbi:hypothetical protein ECG_04009 [Echinococcus granulosus]|nr:hypothetical protein ECG_04009 [Echinococcus granulosus]